MRNVGMPRRAEQHDSDDGDVGRQGTRPQPAPRHDGGAAMDPALRIPIGPEPPLPRCAARLAINEPAISSSASRWPVCCCCQCRRARQAEQRRLSQPVFVGPSREMEKRPPPSWQMPCRAKDSGSAPADPRARAACVSAPVAVEDRPRNAPARTGGQPGNSSPPLDPPVEGAVLHREAEPLRRGDRLQPTVMPSISPALRSWPTGGTEPAFASVISASTWSRSAAIDPLAAGQQQSRRLTTSPVSLATACIASCSSILDSDA